jgi:hypothetical protein
MKGGDDKMETASGMKQVSNEDVLQCIASQAKRIAELEAAAGAAEDWPGAWQPIETAPKDGTRILAYGVLGLETGPSVGCVQWSKKWSGSESHWVVSPNEASEYYPESCELTHWMPLPAPPTA